LRRQGNSGQRSTLARDGLSVIDPSATICRLSHRTALCAASMNCWRGRKHGRTIPLTDVLRSAGFILHAAGKYKKYTLGWVWRHCKYRGIKRDLATDVEMPDGW